MDMTKKKTKKHILRGTMLGLLLIGLSAGCNSVNDAKAAKNEQLAMLAALWGSIKPHGSAQVKMSMGDTTHDVTRITVTVSGSGILVPMVQDLSKVGSTWQGVVSDIPVGSDRLFVGQAFDSAGSLRYQGQAAGVAINANMVTDIFILLQDKNPKPPFQNTVPVIDAFVASTNVIAASGSVDFSVTAHDPNPGDTLTYLWTATGGSFSDATATSTTWTAPATAGSYTITVTVTDNKGASCNRSFVVTVEVNTGSGSVTVGFNHWPFVESILSSECCLASGSSSNLTLVAADADGDMLSYLWSSSCGTFDNTASQNPIFTASSSALSGDCTVTVNLDDGRGGVNAGSLTIRVKAAPLPICTDITTLGVGGLSGDICSSAAFTSGASSIITGNLSALAGVTTGADSIVTGNVSAGAAFTSGANSTVNGNVTAVGDVTLGAASRIIGSVHSGTGVIIYGAGATVGSVVP